MVSFKFMSGVALCSVLVLISCSKEEEPNTIQSTEASLKASCTISGTRANRFDHYSTTNASTRYTAKEGVEPARTIYYYANKTASNSISLKISFPDNHTVGRTNVSYFIPSLSINSSHQLIPGTYNATKTYLDVVRPTEQVSLILYSGKVVGRTNQLGNCKRLLQIDYKTEGRTYFHQGMHSN